MVWNAEHESRESVVRHLPSHVETTRRPMVKDRHSSKQLHHKFAYHAPVKWISRRRQGLSSDVLDQWMHGAVISHPPDCEVLAELYASTGGPSWQPTNWGQSLPANFSSACCSPPLGGYVCDAATGRIVEIVLHSNQLNGSIPESLGTLSKLQQLDLSLNLLTGSIPESLGTLSQLQYLDLNSNQLEGSIPSLLGKFSLLQYLDLSSNQLTGSIPQSLGNLSQLQNLDLYSNELTGAIPSSLSNLSQLLFLTLFSNQLTGSIPASLGNLSQLRLLSLYSNQLTGSIPPSLGNLSQLLLLDLSCNQLTGLIPPSLGNLPQLQELGLYANQLTGSIPSSLGGLSQLRYLDLSSNRLSGTIPSSLGSLSLLEILLLNNNRLSGEVNCGSFGQGLVTLDFHGNALVGPIPSCFCIQDGLNFAFFGYNNFTSFPNCSLASLILLDLSNNRISSFPFANISEFSSLISLDLSYNMFSGKFPSDLFASGSPLRSLSLAYNLYDDVFPLYACNSVKSPGAVVDSATHLEKLDLSGNSITGIPGVVDYNLCSYCNKSAYYSLTSLIMKDSRMPAHFPGFEFDYLGETCSLPSFSFFQILQFLPGLSSLDVSSNDLSVHLDYVLSLPLLSSFDIRNNPNARRSLLSNTNQQQFQYDGATNYPYSTSMSCVQAKVGRLALQADPAFFDFENCVCRPGFYGKPPHCTRCLSNADCSFHTEADIPYGNMLIALRESGNMLAQKGYYASPSVTYLQMMNNQSYPKAIEICPLAGTDWTQCDATPAGPCKSGYEGRLCSTCSSGYFRIGDRCTECPTSAGLAFFGVFAILAVTGLIAWSFFVGSSSSALVKVLVFFWQALFFIRTPMTSGLYIFTHGASSTTMVTVAGPECFFTTWDYTASYTLAVTAPWFALCLVVLIWCVGTFRLRRASALSRKRWIDRCRRSAIFLFMFLFMSAISAVLASLSCTTDAGDGKSYLVFYPDERCSAMLQAVSAILFAVYVVVIPGVLACFVWRSGVLSGTAKPDTRRMYVYSLLFGSYKSNRRWWELVVMLRRILFVAAYVTVPSLSEYRTMLVACLLVVAESLQAIASPYHRSVENSVEIISLGILLVNLACSVQSQVLAVQDVDGAGTIVFLLNSGFSAVLIWMLLEQFARKWRSRPKPSAQESLTENLIESNQQL
eukprot:ANDGO_01823.mRNA.1 putative leucine-rich repeat receptor-like protein kinase At1g35710